MKKTTVLTALSSLFACAPGSGDLLITTYGEDYIESEIPAAASAEEEGFVDGHSVRYSKFLVAMSNIDIEDHDGQVGGQMSEQRIFDLHKKGPSEVHRFNTLDAIHWDAVSIQIKPASAAVAGNANADDVALMNGQGYSVYVEGQLLSGALPVSFAWGFTTSTLYHECETDEGEAGVVVPNGGVADVQFTIHGDHLFYDDLQSPDTKLRGDAIFKADADSDGEVTLAELGAIDLTALPLGQYGTGGDGTVENLQQFVAALSRTVVHFQGEGECKAVKQ